MTTPYRDDTDSLEARHAALASELASVQAKTKELDALKTSEAHLAKEVADVAKKLEGRRSRRTLPLLDTVQIASPCTASWDEMIGDDRARFCTHCQKDVFNLSAMPKDEAESFIQTRTAEVCVRLYKRTDGTVLTSDCPVGVKRKRRRKALVAAVGGSLLAAGALLAASMRSKTIAETDDDSSHVMGKWDATPVTVVNDPVVDTVAPVTPPAPTSPMHKMGKMKMPDPPAQRVTPKPVVTPTPKPGARR